MEGEGPPPRSPRRSRDLQVEWRTPSFGSLSMHSLHSVDEDGEEDESPDITPFGSFDL